MKRYFLLMTFLLVVVLGGCGKDEVVSQSSISEDHSIRTISDINKTQFEKQSITLAPKDEENPSEVVVGEETSDEIEDFGEDKSHKNNNNSMSDKSSKSSNNKITTEETAKEESKEKVNSSNKDEQNRNSNQEKVGTKNAKEKESNESTRKEDSKSENTEEENVSETPVEEPTEPEKTVTISITTGDVRGTILPPTQVKMKDGDTALDLTQKITREKGIPFSVRGSNVSAYVEGIDNLYEFDEGPLSGWLVRINGVLIDKSAGAYTMTAGQEITWMYSTNYLEDGME